MGAAWDAVRWHDRLDGLVDDLAGRGILTDRTWRAGLREVPRHRFVPTRAWAEPQSWNGQSHLIDRTAAPSDWWNAVYSDTSIITQRDDGATDPTDPSGAPTCSLSCPSIAMEYLHLLDLQDHHRVMEIGTGTGWTAAMLAWRLRGSSVITVEVDKALAETARDNLDHLSERPDVITGDGADGHPLQAPYDRIHVTCGVRDIPVAWLEQVRPGGIIVVPWMPIGGDAYGQQLVLDVIGDGTAVGRCVGGGGFMMLRSQRVTAREHGRDGTDEPSTTRMDPRLIARADGGAQLALHALVHGLSITTGWNKAADGWSYTVRLNDGAGSTAMCSAPRGADEYDVVQAGPRRLWDEAVAAYLWWLKQGRPARDRFGVTVTPGCQDIWLDNPSNTLKG
ncbi:rRNA adenine N-6-methyltransferase family protein [Actinomadura roseirufa]|uniref:rRNA adenine N-6-methyltransferase family protein n=1 Tax=Actinomadura roseirufa TaxID=2094049 RepID=UPI0013F157ED|nr:rRNA adenine N-6-methyltransferase family protein [Actinomadura roseirufa]